MSDQPSSQQGAGSLPELTPEQEAAVRRMLAEARHDAPIPPDVADRLDTVLAGLTRDEPGSPGVAPVVDLAARRRRRNAAALLAGAAAVIVAGFAGGQLIGADSDDSGADTASAGSNADREAKNDAGGEAAAPESLGDDAASAPADEVPVPLGQALRLSSQHLARDVTDQLGSFATSSGSVRAPGYAAFDAVGCTPPPAPSKFGGGELFPALFDGRPAVLALRPPAGGTQQADVLACDTATSLASVTIPSR